MRSVEIHALLAPGGVFVNLDRTTRRWQAWRTALLRRWAPDWQQGAYGATLARHLRMLADAGFATRWEPVPKGILFVALERAESTTRAT